jgi:hypothetical protein
MTDIMERLRRSGEFECYCEEAADEIERLRSAGRTADRILADSQEATKDAVNNAVAAERAAILELLEDDSLCFPRQRQAIAAAIKARGTA